MSRRNVFQLIYYSQLPLVILAMVLTSSISAVLHQQVDWQVILLVGLSTYFTYSIDNLIDWKKDQRHYTNIVEIVRIYHKITYILIPSSGFGIVILTMYSSNELRISILLLGAAVAMGTTRFSHYRENSSNPDQSIHRFILNRIFISIIWTTVCVFLPSWYRDSEISPRLWRTFLYMYNLIFLYAVLWKLEKSQIMLKRRLLNSILMPALGVMTIISMFIAVLDVVTGAAPPHNLINLLPPVASVVSLFYISKTPLLLREKISILTLALIFLSVISAGVHLFAV